MLDVLKRTVREFREDNLTDWAAALTYYSVLSIFPGLAALVAILALFGSEGTIDSLLEIIDDIGPASAVDTFRDPVETVVNSNTGAGLALVLSLALSLWTASGYIGAFMRASNAIYEVE
jgi:membrane protein